MWKGFLSQWQSDVRFVCSLMPDDRYSEDERRAVESIVLTHAPASFEQIEAAERRLGLQLDDSLKSFYLASNGWLQYGFDANDLIIRPVEDVRPLTSEDADYVRDVGSYFTGVKYGPERRFFESKYLSTALIVSDICNDGCYLANRRDDESWEFGIVFFESAPKYFSTFEALMRFENNRCLNNLRSLL